MGRNDAKKVQMPGLMQCAIDLKPYRSGNEVYINYDMDVTNLVDYIQKKKAEGVHYTYFNAFMTAIGKVIYNRPKLNRFIAKRHMWERNEIILSFVAKMELTDKSEEIMLCLNVDPEDNIDSITEKLTKKIDNLRGRSGEKVSKKGSNKAIDVLSKLPNILRVPVFAVLKFMTKNGILPKSLAKDNIYFSSMIVSNLGSINCGAIYHNIADFGTNSALATMGTIMPKKVLNKDGSEEIKQFCEFGITLDERIADGFYFAKSCKMIEYILNHPTLLEEPANTKIEMD